jgi:hypothetical protein
MDWVEEFYRNQGTWSSAYSGDAKSHSARKAALIGNLADDRKMVLELGAGGRSC